MSFIQIVAEAANGPTTLAADKVLRDKNVLVIPVSTLSSFFNDF